MAEKSDKKDGRSGEPAALTGSARLYDWWRRFASGRAELRGPEAALGGALVLLSVIYGIVASLVLWLRALRRATFSVPIISVGNIVAGGAGKTPLTIFLARRLLREGRNVAVVSRGYGRTSRGTVLVSRGEQPLVTWREAGDEPYLMSLVLNDVGVVVSARRSRGVRYAVEKLGADAILLDDAFQHVQLARDLDVVAVDAERPVGNGHLLPGGPLREHPSGVARADILVATRCDRARGSARVAGALGPLAPGVPIVESRMKPVEFWDVRTGEAVDASELKGADAFALSSIADPADFERTLKRLGVRTRGSIALPDHYDYSDEDVAVVVEAAREVGAEVIVTTEKDAVRLRPWRSTTKLVALGIELDVTKGKRALTNAIRRALKKGRDDEA